MLCATIISLQPSETNEFHERIGIVLCCDVERYVVWATETWAVPKDSWSTSPLKPVDKMLLPNAHQAQHFFRILSKWGKFKSRPARRVRLMRWFRPGQLLASALNPDAGSGSRTELQSQSWLQLGVQVPAPVAGSPGSSPESYAHTPAHTSAPAPSPTSSPSPSSSPSPNPQPQPQPHLKRPSPSPSPSLLPGRPRPWPGPGAARPSPAPPPPS